MATVYPGVPAELLCQKHVVIAHAQVHRFLERIRAGRDVEGAVARGEVNVGRLYQRHQELAGCIPGHKTELTREDVEAIVVWMEEHSCHSRRKKAVIWRRLEGCKGCRRKVKAAKFSMDMMHNYEEV